MPTRTWPRSKGILGGSTVVGLGESVHTSGGYSQAKFRLFKFLVEDMGFRAFAFESPWVEAEKAARYVDTCGGTAREAWLASSPSGTTPASRRSLTWMCQYNQQHPADRLRFFGFDVQQPGTTARPCTAFLRKGAPADADSLLKDLAACDGGAAGRPTAIRN